MEKNSDSLEKRILEKISERLEKENNKTLKNIREALTLKQSESDSLRLLDENCKNCGEQQVYCGYRDIGGLDYYDNFWHLCLNCLDAKHKEEWGSFYTEGPVHCPFCNYKWA